MSSTEHPSHGQIGYLQLPALDVAQSARFYETVFGWNVDATHAGFEAPGMIGQWITDRTPGANSGAVVWICVDQIASTLKAVIAHGGTVHGAAQLDNGERWLAEIDDPAGNRLAKRHLRLGFYASDSAPPATPYACCRHLCVGCAVCGGQRDRAEPEERGRAQRSTSARAGLVRER